MPESGAYIYVDVGQGFDADDDDHDPYGWVHWCPSRETANRVAKLLRGRLESMSLAGLVFVIPGHCLGDSWILADDHLAYAASDQGVGLNDLRDFARRAEGSIASSSTAANKDVLFLEQLRGMDAAKHRLRRLAVPIPSSVTVHEVSRLTPRQSEVWKALSGRCLRWDALAAELRNKEQGIKELVKGIRTKFGKNAIITKRFYGYFRPDAPPNWDDVKPRKRRQVRPR